MVALSAEVTLPLACPCSFPIPFSYPLLATCFHHELFSYPCGTPFLLPPVWAPLPPRRLYLKHLRVARPLPSEEPLRVDARLLAHAGCCKVRSVVGVRYFLSDFHEDPPPAWASPTVAPQACMYGKSLYALTNTVTEMSSSMRRSPNASHRHLRGSCRLTSCLNQLRPSPSLTLAVTCNAVSARQVTSTMWSKAETSVTSEVSSQWRRLVCVCVYS